MARRLGARLGWPTFDTDDLLAAAVGCPAAEYLVRHGEPEFRAREVEMVLAALRVPGAKVIALGGGAVLSARVRSSLAPPEHFVVFLSAPVPVLVERQRTGGARPPLTGRPLADEVEHLFRSREPLYRAVCDLEVDTNSADADGCLHQIMATMATMGHRGS
jgi:shikimate kinase